MSWTRQRGNRQPKVWALDRFNMVADVRTGIWMCRSRDANILVMDVEGTDDRERGEQVGGDQCYKSKNNDSATTI